MASQPGGSQGSAAPNSSHGHHHNYAYWAFMQQPQQQAPDAPQPQYNYAAQQPYQQVQQPRQPFVNYFAPAAANAAGAQPDPWGQLANTFNYFQPGQQQQHNPHQQQQQPAYQPPFASTYFQHPTSAQQHAPVTQQQAAGTYGYQQPNPPNSAAVQGHQQQQYHPYPQAQHQQQQPHQVQPVQENLRPPSPPRPSAAPTITPDLVVAASTHGATGPNTSDSAPPDLWYGHASNARGAEPDVVWSRNDERLDEVALDSNSTSGRDSNQRHPMMNLDDYYQAPEAERQQSLMSAAGAILSMAGGVNAQQQRDVFPYENQPDSHHNQKQGQHRLGISELYTHSYYEADVTQSASAESASTVVEHMRANEEMDRELENAAAMDNPEATENGPKDKNEQKTGDNRDSRDLWNSTPQNETVDVEAANEENWSNVDWDVMNCALQQASLEKQSRITDPPLLTSQQSYVSSQGGGITTMVGMSQERRTTSVSPKLSPQGNDAPPGPIREESEKSIGESEKNENGQQQHQDFDAWSMSVNFDEHSLAPIPSVPDSMTSWNPWQEKERGDIGEEMSGLNAEEDEEGVTEDDRTGDGSAFPPAVSTSNNEAGGDRQTASCDLRPEAEQDLLPEDQQTDRRVDLLYHHYQGQNEAEDEGRRESEPSDDQDAAEEDGGGWNDWGETADLDESRSDVQITMMVPPENAAQTTLIRAEKTQESASATVTEIRQSVQVEKGQITSELTIVKQENVNFLSENPVKSAADKVRKEEPAKQMVKREETPPQPVLTVRVLEMTLTNLDENCEVPTAVEIKKEDVPTSPKRQPPVLPSHSPGSFLNKKDPATNKNPSVALKHPLVSLKRDDSAVWSTVSNYDDKSERASVVQSNVDEEEREQRETRRSFGISRHIRRDSGSSEISNASSIMASVTGLSGDNPGGPSNSPSKRRQESLHKRFREASAKSKLALERLQREKGLLSSSPTNLVQPAVSLLSGNSPTTAVRAKPITLLPVQTSASSSAQVTPLPSPAEFNEKLLSTKKKSTPKDDEDSSDARKRGKNEKKEKLSVPATMPKSQSSGGILKKEKEHAATSGIRGKNRRRSAPEEDEDAEDEEDENRRDSKRPSSRGSVHSAYEGGYDYERHGPRRGEDEPGNYQRDADWYRSYYKRRPYSRASDREDWWRFYQPRDDRNRPRSTQSFAGADRGEYDDDEYDEDERERSENDEYEDDDERREMGAYYRRHKHNFHNYQRYQAYQYQMTRGAPQVFDPAWQRYVTEYYRYYGRYPTYDQLHRMWTEQQSRYQQQQQQQQHAHKKHDHQQHLEKSAEGDRAKMLPAAGADVTDAGHSKQLLLHYGVPEEREDSQASLSRAKMNEENARGNAVNLQGSERSFEVRSDLSSNVSGVRGHASHQAPQIREPPKHSVSHAICRFGAGGHLIMVTSGGRSANFGLVNQAKTVEIRNIRTFITDAVCHRVMERIEQFPGPLTAKDTSKTAVVQFCQNKLDECRKFTAAASNDEDPILTDRDSVALVWRLLLLLVRQNGVAFGNDLAQLVLENQATGTRADEATGMDWDREVERELFRPPNEDEDAERWKLGGDSAEEAEDDSDADHAKRSKRREPLDRTLINCATQTTDRVEYQFRQLLLSGNKKEALEWAMKYRLWGHALFLAMKVDQRTHTNVMTRFANSLALNDPLQTLYQMLSGGVPYAVTRIPDEKWGDWRPHLAMILSNLTTPDTTAPDATSLDQQQQQLWSVLTMGNTLMNAGRPYAAHFCYLCCHLLAGWDVFSPNADDMQQKRLITLIGADHEERPDRIFTLERLQCTEVYEYAMGLRNYAAQNQVTALPQIQIYKWIYAVRLADFGYREEAYRYLFQISSAIQAYPQLFASGFAKAIYEVACHLQQFDPTVEVLGSSFRSWREPAWLKDMTNLILNLETTQQYQPSQNGGNLPSNEAQAHESQVQQMQQYSSHRPSLQPQPGVEKPTDELFYYQQQQQPGAPIHTASRQSSVAPDWDRRSSISQSEVFDPMASGSSLRLVPENMNMQNQDPMVQMYGYPPASGGINREAPGSPTAGSRYDSAASEAVSENVPTSRSYAAVVTPTRGMTSSSPGSPTASKPPGRSDYWDSMTNNQQLHDNQPKSFLGNRNNTVDTRASISVQRPSSDMSSPQAGAYGSPGQNSVFGDSPPHQQQSQQQFLSSRGNEMAPSNPMSKPVPQGHKAPINSAPAAALATEDKMKRSSSWFGRAVGNVIYKIMPKGPNEMILPDDRQKKIIWDQNKQKWVNLDGDEDENNAPAAPPPSDSQLGGPGVASFDYGQSPLVNGGFVGGQQMGQPQAQQQQDMQNANASNRFAMKGGRRYVDLMGAPSPANANHALVPPPLPQQQNFSMPAGTNFFMPQPTDTNEQSGYDSASPFSIAEPMQHETQAMRSRTTSQSSNVSNTAPASNWQQPQEPGMMFMDPSQYQSVAHAQSSGSTGGGNRLMKKRYPNQ